MRIILASASPRRRELLTQMGLEFEVCPSGGEEVITKEIPSEVVMELAARKAGEVAEKICRSVEIAGSSSLRQTDETERIKTPDQTLQLAGTQEQTESAQSVDTSKLDGILVIGADTIVVKDHKILGKPKGAADAARMLFMLQGDVHQVYTGVCLIFMEGETQNIHTFYEKTDVYFNPMTEQEIWDYVNTGDPLDKAGAYGIQGVCGKYIRGIEGDYHNVVGLPIARLYQEMKKLTKK